MDDQELNEQLAMEMFSLGFEVGLQVAKERAMRQEEEFWRPFKNMPRLQEPEYKCECKSRPTNGTPTRNIR
jgi:hypothetical protein